MLYTRLTTGVFFNAEECIQREKMEKKQYISMKDTSKSFLNSDLLC